MPPNTMVTLQNKTLTTHPPPKGHLGHLRPHGWTHPPPGYQGDLISCETLPKGIRFKSNESCEYIPFTLKVTRLQDQYGVIIDLSGLSRDARIVLGVMK